MFETYPYNYNPYYMQPMPSTYQSPQIQGVKFVQNLQEAQSCSIPLGTRVIFMNQDEDVFYIKEMDYNGVSNVTEYEFKKKEPIKETRDYITKDEFEQWRKGYEQFIEQQLLSKKSAQPDEPINTVYQDNKSGASESTSRADATDGQSVFSGI